MRTKDITKALGITKERIKYFKEQGVFIPENPNSSEHSDLDFENLKRLVIYTKAGLTCGDIKKIQKGTCDLKSALQYRREKLQARMEQINGAMLISEEMLNNGEQHNTFSTDYYWDEIQLREQQGDIFMDIDDYDFKDGWFKQIIICPCCGTKQEVDLEDYLCDETCNEERLDNGMGPDIVYDFDSDDIFECCSCGRTIRIFGWLREYPIGAYDSHKIYVKSYQENEE